MFVRRSACRQSSPPLPPSKVLAALAAAESLHRVCRRRWLLAAQPAIAGRGAFVAIDRLTPPWPSCRATTSFAAAPALDLAGLRPLMTGRGPAPPRRRHGAAGCRARTGRAVAGRKFKQEARSKKPFQTNPRWLFLRLRVFEWSRTTRGATCPHQRLATVGGPISTSAELIDWCSERSF